MKHKVAYVLIAGATVALLVFVCMNFRITRADRIIIVDGDVRAWLEGVVNNETNKAYASNSMFILIPTTRNSIIAQPSFPSTCEVGDSIYGCAVINGVRLIVLENELEDTIPTVFEKTKKKTVILQFSSFAHFHTIPFLNLYPVLSEWEEYHYKYVDDEWRVSTWKETFGEQMEEEYNQWTISHPDTLVQAPAIEPFFTKKFSSLTENNYKSFINDWKLWSNQLRAYSTDTLANQAVNRIFSDYIDNSPDSCALYSLPSSIEIRKYSGTYCDYPFNDDWDKTEEWEYMMKASDRYSYVPSFDSNKDIVYMTPEINDMLSLYIGGVSESKEDDVTDNSKWTKINDDRVAELRSLIQVCRGHWGGYWHFCTMPIIYSLYLYDDGFIANLRTSWYSGETVFVPYDKSKEKEEILGWIE